MNKMRDFNRRMSSLLSSKTAVDDSEDQPPPSPQTHRHRHHFATHPDGMSSAPIEVIADSSQQHSNRSRTSSPSLKRQKQAAATTDDVPGTPKSSPPSSDRRTDAPDDKMHESAPLHKNEKIHDESKNQEASSRTSRTDEACMRDADGAGSSPSLPSSSTLDGAMSSAMSSFRSLTLPNGSSPVGRAGRRPSIRRRHSIASASSTSNLSTEEDSLPQSRRGSLSSIITEVHPLSIGEELFLSDSDSDSNDGMTDSSEDDEL